MGNQDLAPPSGERAGKREQSQQFTESERPNPARTEKVLCVISLELEHAHGDGFAPVPCTTTGRPNFWAPGSLGPGTAGGLEFLACLGRAETRWRAFYPQSARPRLTDASAHLRPSTRSALAVAWRLFGPLPKLPPRAPSARGRSGFRPDEAQQDAAIYANSPVWGVTAFEWVRRVFFAFLGIARTDAARDVVVCSIAGRWCSY